MRLENKVALITGASSGIGKESALLFAQEGAKIVAVDVNDAEGEKTVSEVKASGGEAIYAHADISKAADCEAMVKDAENKFGKLNVMFNNAGIMDSRDDNALVTEEEVWDLTMAINLKGVFLGCKYGIAAMQRAGGGSIINTASFVGLMGAATPQVAYTASKGGVNAFIKAASLELAKDGITVNAVSPGNIQTDSLKELYGEDGAKEVAKVIPAGDLGDTADIGYAMVYLASDQAKFVTGQAIVVDGGQILPEDPDSFLRNE